MNYAESLGANKFILYHKCRCNGTLKESYNSTSYIGYDIIVYPENNHVKINYRSMNKFSGQLNQLETKLQEILPKAA